MKSFSNDTEGWAVFNKAYLELVNSGKTDITYNDVVVKIATESLDEQINPSETSTLLPSEKIEVPELRNASHYRAITFNRLHELMEDAAKKGNSKLLLFEPEYKFGSGMLVFLRTKGFGATFIDSKSGNNYVIITW